MHSSMVALDFNEIGKNTYINDIMYRNSTHTVHLFIYFFFLHLFLSLCDFFFAISFTYTTAQHNIVTDDVVFFKRLLYTSQSHFMHTIPLHIFSEDY